MEKIVITRPDETVANIVELANEINVEHGQVQAAIRDGLAHAKKAGTLLLQAKSRVPHGNWLPWLDANCMVSARTAQKYMQLAQHWDEVIENGGKGIALHSALKLITHQNDDPEVSNTSRATYLPPALAYYQKNGHLDDNALRQLLDLSQDYGPDVFSPMELASPFPEEKIAPVWMCLNVIRPLDHPPLWPYPVADDTPAGVALTAAVKIFLADGHARGGKIPQWEVSAFWFGATMTHLANTHPEVAEDFAGILRRSLESWRLSFRTALVFVGCLGPKFLKDKDADRVYWGYHSDLRHAGAVKAALEMKEDPNAHPGLFHASEAGFDDIDRQESYVLPSSMQGRLDRCTVTAGKEDEHGDAWEHPEDRPAPTENK